MSILRLKLLDFFKFILYYNSVANLDQMQRWRIGTTNAARPPTLKINILNTQRWRSGKYFVLRYDERCASAHSQN